MCSVELHNRINQIIELFYRLGLWQRESEATIKEIVIKILYSVFYLLFPITLLSGAIATNKKYETIFLAKSTIVTSVTFVKLLYILWKKENILNLLHRLGVYSIDDQQEVARVNDKVQNCISFVKILFYFGYFISICCVLVVPFICSERKLFFNIGFPLNWEKNEFTYYLTFSFIAIETFITLIAMLFNILVWYLLLNCALNYSVLGRQIKNIGIENPLEEVEIETLSNLEMENLYLEELDIAIKSHQYINESTYKLDAFLSNLFLLQITTSGLCICGSLYCLLFIVSDNAVESLIYLSILIYNILDIFMVTYLGNEIKLSSDKLSYCLFESNWIDQPQSTKKCVIIFGTNLIHPNQLVIGKLYPLTLDTFARILNSAYTMFTFVNNLTKN